MEVILKDSLGSLNILALMLRQILLFARVGDLGFFGNRRQVVWVKAGSMSVSLTFTEEGVKVENGEMGEPDLILFGNMGDLLKTAGGSLPVLPYLRGRLGFKGNPLLALTMMRLLRVRT